MVWDQKNKQELREAVLKALESLPLTAIETTRQADEYAVEIQHRVGEAIVETIPVKYRDASPIKSLRTSTSEAGPLSESERRAREQTEHRNYLHNVGKDSKGIWDLMNSAEGWQSLSGMRETRARRRGADAD